MHCKNWNCPFNFCREAQVGLTGTDVGVGWLKDDTVVEDEDVLEDEDGLILQFDLSRII